MPILKIVFSLFPIFTLPYCLCGRMHVAYFLCKLASYILACHLASQPLLLSFQANNVHWERTTFAMTFFFHTAELTGLSVFVKHLLLCNLADV